MDQQDVAIVGGGLAGAKCAEQLRARGFPGQISIYAAEDHLPYERPPLSKDYLQGKTPFEDALVHNEAWYAEQRITVHTATEVEAIDPASKTLRTAGGSAGWDKLILATGSVARHLPLPGADAPNVYYLRTIEESTAIRGQFGAGKRLAIIGGGWIGLEVAAAARIAGTEVTILEGAPQPLLNVLGPEIAPVFAALHRDHGVTVRTGVRITGLDVEDSQATGVRLESGEIVPADAVVIGIGVAPDTRLAEQAGLAVDNGVLVDAALATSDPNIWAVGDIANHAHPVLGHRVRVEHWAMALNQPAAVAASIMGTRTEYTELPYFFSDQYDLGMEYIGHAPNGSYDRIITRGEPDSLEFMAFWVDSSNRVLAGMNVNIWDVMDDFKALIVSQKAINPAKLLNPEVTLDQLL